MKFPGILLLTQHKKYGDEDTAVIYLSIAMLNAAIRYTDLPTPTSQPTGLVWLLMTLAVVV
jgi:hypothetical protein